MLPRSNSSSPKLGRINNCDSQQLAPYASQAARGPSWDPPPERDLPTALHAWESFIFLLCPVPLSALHCSEADLCLLRHRCEGAQKSVFLNSFGVPVAGRDRGRSSHSDGEAETGVTTVMLLQ